MKPSYTETSVVGTFSLTEGSMRVSDPCYTVDTWCAGVVPAKPGTWTATLLYSDQDTWGTRVSAILVEHETHLGPKPMYHSSIDVGVDSGQCGLFAAQEYPSGKSTGEYGDTSSFYGRACRITLDSEEKGGILDNMGVVSRSGFGDGSYTLLTSHLDHSGEENTALMVVFIEETCSMCGDADCEDYECEYCLECGAKYCDGECLNCPECGEEDCLDEECLEDDDA